MRWRLVWRNPANNTESLYIASHIYAIEGMESEGRALIDELDYCGYFLTMWEIVRFCREQEILCQGRGSAANSVMISADGSVWCGTSLGAVRLRFGKLEGARVSDDGIQITRLTTFDGLIDDRVTTIHETPDGTLWMGTEAGLSHFDGTNFGSNFYFISILNS